MDSQNITASAAVSSTSISPVAPRFERSTMRGSKRVFSVSKFDGNLCKKQMVQYRMRIALSCRADLFTFSQVKPPGWSANVTQQIDSWLYKQIQRTVIARAKALEKDQFYHYLTDVLLKKCPPPREFGGEAAVKSVIEVMFADYYS